MPSSPPIAKVIVNLSLDRTFDYRIPDRLRRQIHIGCRVTVPFNNTIRPAYVLDLAWKSDFPDKLKDIAEIDSDGALIPENLIGLGEWMADYYCCPRDLAIRSLLPGVVRGGKVKPKTHLVIRLADGVDVPKLLEEIGSRAPKQAEIIKLLNLRQEMSLAYANRISTSAVTRLRQDGHVVDEEVQQERDPFENDSILPTLPLPLMDEQEAAMQVIQASFDKKKKDVILLHGVTGSGKTEVYLQAIAQCLERGQEAIVLVPEISLTPQTTERFRGRFGDQVSVLHSHLSDGERFDEWFKVSEGKVKIVVGARSAIFAPFKNLGLIVVDEEHETSYKQTEMAPRYHARDIAVVRGHRENITVLLGSATPSLESFQNTVNGKYVRSVLAQRVDDREMPTMEVVDMVAEAEKQGQPQILSERLKGCVFEALENQEQVILFLNRRGYATHMQCLKCGFVAECDDCSVKYTYHRHKEQLVCHFCGMALHAHVKCPECGDENIRYGGLGTEKVEAVVKAVFKGARVQRMDSDTMTRKDSYRETLTAFRAGAIDILVGTQMIAKGLDFPNVTLVGIIFADLSLNLPDFRAGERTFQLLVQVAGRAGRGMLPGRVVVQTYTPYHPAIQAALRQDFNEFFNDEIIDRKGADFPPLSHMVLIGFRGKDEGLTERTATELHDHIGRYMPADTELIPPLPSPIARKRGFYHFFMLINTQRIVQVSRRLKRAMRDFNEPREVRITIDVDPYSIL